MMGGSPGGTVSLANSFPALALELFNHGRARDEVNGVPLQERVSRINAAISGTHGVAGVKAAMTLAGFRGGIPRRPLLSLEPVQVQALRALLVAEGLLP
jgi:4-hydroxy-2-oxoglutarate aldolase